MSLDRPVEASTEAAINKESKSEIGQQQIFKMTVNAKEPQVAFVLGKNKDFVLRVPKELTVPDSHGNPKVAQFPVIDDRGERYDALTILKDLKAQPSSHPATLDFDEDFFEQKCNYMRTVLENKAHAEYFKENEAVHDIVKRYAGEIPAIKKSEEIKNLATFLNVQITHSPAHNEPSIAVPKNPALGPRNIAGMFLSSVSTSIYQSVKSIFDLSLVTNSDYFMIPMTAAMFSKVLQMPAYDCHTRFFSFNHFSVPSVFLNTASGVATFAVNAALKARFASGLSDPFAHLVAFAVPLCVTSVEVATLRYGPKLVTKVSGASATVRNCAYSAGTMLKSCGMQLWSCKRDEPQAAPSQDLSRALLSI